MTYGLRFPDNDVLYAGAELDDVRELLQYAQDRSRDGAVQWEGGEPVVRVGTSEDDAQWVSVADLGIAWENWMEAR